MQDRTVADMPVGFDDRCSAGKGMNDAIILYIGPVTNLDLAKIAPQACSGSDITAMAENDISYEHCLGMNERILGNDRHKSFETIAIRHPALHFSSRASVVAGTKRASSQNPPSNDFPGNLHAQLFETLC